jgi:biofilm PGA synthesis N-glycosyltransferase PgaC
LAAYDSVRFQAFDELVMLTPQVAEKVGSESRTSSVPQVRYVVITPARNEEHNIEETIRSMMAQTITPSEWIIVDDGSTDKTAEILDRYAAQCEWLRVFHLPDRGYREPGNGVIRAFNHGLSNLGTNHWDFIVKLDGDLDLSPGYFQMCFGEFEKDPTLAVGGGTICHSKDGVLLPDFDQKMHVRGATKIYRRTFWDQLGGLYPVAGWDTIDELKANMLGWTTRSFRDIQILHRRPTGSADGAWKNWFKNGRANYITGYHPVFMLLKCVKRLSQKPIVLAGIALWCGFVSGYIKGIPRVDEPDLIRYVRKQQLSRLLFQESIWK